MWSQNQFNARQSDEPHRSSGMSLLTNIQPFLYEPGVLGVLEQAGMSDYQVSETGLSLKSNEHPRVGMMQRIKFILRKSQRRR